MIPAAHSNDYSIVIEDYHHYYYHCMSSDVADEQPVVAEGEDDSWNY